MVFVVADRDAAELYWLEDAVYLFSGPLEPDEPEEELNDVGHQVECQCRECLPEAHEAVEEVAA